MNEVNNTIYSINGPVVKAADTRDFSMLEMVFVGNKRLIGVREKSQTSAENAIISYGILLLKSSLHSAS